MKVQQFFKLYEWNFLRNLGIFKQPRAQYCRMILNVSKNEDINQNLVKSRPPREQFGLELPTIKPLKAWRKARYCYVGFHGTFPKSKG